MKDGAFGLKIDENFEENISQISKEFNFISLEKPIDSSNLNFKNILEIRDLIILNYEKYKAFIILHGTDTLCYTATMISFLIQTNKPIIFTGSQIPLSKTRNDAVLNFTTSLYFAKLKINEVCICFNNKIFRANRTTKATSSDFDAFASPNFPTLARFDLNLHENSHLYLKQSFFYHDIKKLKNKVGFIFLTPEINKKALISYSSFHEALIFLSYGVGNISQNLEKIISKIAKEKIIVNVSQCYKSNVSSLYEVSNYLNNLGVINAKDLTKEAAFCKLNFLLNLQKDVKKEFLKPICGEIT